MSYHMYKAANAEWRWYLMAANGRKIADSGEGYKNKSDCAAAIALVKSSAAARVHEE